MSLKGIEAYFGIFEKVTEHKNLPKEQWASILMEPQKFYVDLQPQDAKKYSKPESEVLARFRVTKALLSHCMV